MGGREDRVGGGVKSVRREGEGEGEREKEKVRGEKRE